MKYLISFFSLYVLSVLPAWSQGPPAPSAFSNPLAITLIVLMLLLLIIIGVLSNVLLGMAELKVAKRKSTAAQKGIIAMGILLLSLTSSFVFAQEGATSEAVATVVKTIGGMSASDFYVMVTVIFLELAVILALLINIKFLIRKEIPLESAFTTEQEVLKKKNKLSWWDRFNKLKPISQEADLDLGHDYDGIRELDNRLPPWWLYGFYLSIIVAVIYFWRFQVSHDGPSSIQEYEMSVAKAELKIQNYLKSKGESVDENTVTILTAPEDLSKGKIIFEKSCAACHKADGGGVVGPNLTDDYWLHGNDIKSVFKTVKYGINAMPQWQSSYSNKEIAQVASYLKSLHGTNPPAAKAQEGVLQKEDGGAVTTTAKDSTAISDTTMKK